MSCLIPSNIIGLSRTTCTCPEFANKPTEDLLSNYYIDQYVNIELAAYGNCGTGSIWDKLHLARQQAIDDFLPEFMAMLTPRHKAEPTFFNEIGQRFKNPINYNSKKFAGLKITPSVKNGNTFCLKKMWIGVTIGGATELKFWKGYGENSSSIRNIELVRSESITLLSNDFTEVKLSIPFEFQLIAGEHWFITYELPTGSFPFANNVQNCSCGGHDYSWAKSVKVQGFSLLDETETTFIKAELSETASGMIIKPHISCDTSRFFCDLVEIGSSDVNFLYLAVAIQYKAAVILLEMLKRENKINFISLTKGTTIEKEIVELSTQYGFRLTKLVEKFPAENFRCLNCNANISYSVGSILT